ncbi:site-specific integrase [Helicobacter sp. 13S00477-4]|uniref:tyrosine-type recombinase/integrase n=1 Tax=Helicobacter sp. 13S00477-4 TaxID=1905759 RepID=UPI000BA514DC|nr:site-specific integrase [Helicobacter sp. 13S00477-4]PAF51975.1 hypothetical protein BKH44_04765 [Helicobacter sp. 13S00477-4]
METEKKYKYAKIRNGIIYLHICEDNKRLRFSTKLLATEKNLQLVEKNPQKFLRQKNEEILQKTSSTKKVGIRNKSILLKDFAQQSFNANSNTRKSSTNKNYDHIFKKHILPTFGNMDIRTINSFHIKSWQNDLCSTTGIPTINIAKKILSYILKDALHSELIDKNPTTLTPNLKAQKKKIQPFSLDEVKQIISNAQGWFKNLLLLAFFTGMRVGEMMALTWEDIDFIDNKITISKSMRNGILGKPKTRASNRVIDMLPIVKEALLKQYQITSSQPYVFMSSHKTGFKFSSGLSSVYWYPLLKQLGFSKRTFHNSRHTFASIMISKGEDPVWVGCKMLGHENVAMTLSIYTKYIDEDKKRASFLQDIHIA